MAKKNTENSYDISRDCIRGPVLILHIDAVSGSEVKAAGEGVQSFGICLRQMMPPEGSTEEKTPPLRVSMHNVFIAKKAGTEKFQRYQVGANGRTTLGPSVEGATVIGDAVKRLDPQVAATLYAKAAAFAVKALAAVQAQAAKSKAA